MEKEEGEEETFSGDADTSKILNQEGTTASKSAYECLVRAADGSAVDLSGAAHLEAHPRISNACMVAPNISELVKYTCDDQSFLTMGGRGIVDSVYMSRQAVPGQRRCVVRFKDAREISPEQLEFYEVKQRQYIQMQTPEYRAQQLEDEVNTARLTKSRGAVSQLDQSVRSTQRDIDTVRQSIKARNAERLSTLKALDALRNDLQQQQQHTWTLSSGPEVQALREQVVQLEKRLTSLTAQQEAERKASSVTSATVTAETQTLNAAVTDFTALRTKLEAWINDGRRKLLEACYAMDPATTQAHLDITGTWDVLVRGVQQGKAHILPDPDSSSGDRYIGFYVMTTTGQSEFFRVVPISDGTKRSQNTVTAQGYAFASEALVREAGGDVAAVGVRVVAEKPTACVGATQLTFVEGGNTWTRAPPEERPRAAAAAPVAPAAPANLRATLFQHCDYWGWSVQLGPGNYTLADLQGLGFINNDMSAVRVPQGLRVTLYEDDNFLGAALALERDTSCLLSHAKSTGGNWNDVVSSVRVEYLGPQAQAQAQAQTQTQTQIMADPSLRRNFCVDVSNASTSPGAQVFMWPCHDGTNQRWQFDRSTQQVRAAHSGLCLDISGGSTRDLSRVVQQPCNSGSGSQRFQLAPGSAQGTVQLRPHHASGKCIDVQGERTDNGAPLILYTCNGNRNQRFFMNEISVPVPSGGGGGGGGGGEGYKFTRMPVVVGPVTSTSIAWYQVYGSTQYWTGVGVPLWLSEMPPWNQTAVKSYEKVYNSTHPNDTNCRFDFQCDNYGTLFLNDQAIANSDTWMQTKTVYTGLRPGLNRIVITCTNTDPPGAGGCVMSCSRRSDNAVLFVTDSSWRMN